MRNLANFLVHLFGRAEGEESTRLPVVHDRCLYCDELIRDSHSYLTSRVCPFCRFHYTITARERIELLADRGTFKESHKYLSSVAPCPSPTAAATGNCWPRTRTAPASPRPRSPGVARLTAPT